MEIHNIISIKDLCFSYPADDDLLKNISMDVKKGDFIIIRGPSGCGKSTLLKTINGLFEPSSGKIFFHDKPYSDYNIIYLRKKICYIHQLPVILEGSIRDNLTFQFHFESYKGTTPPKEDKLEKLLSDFLMEDISLDRNAEDLSAGQKQRLSVIRALIIDPEIILLDEPTSALDKNACGVFYKLIEKLNLDYQKTVIIVTHSDFCFEQISPKLFYLENHILSEKKTNADS